MKNKYLIFILSILLIVSLAVFLSGCMGEDDALEGKNIVTFDVNGGVLNYGTSSTDTTINFAYVPGTKIIDPVGDKLNYKISNTGYNFTGWYKDKECTEEWDFDTYFNSETLTLYAGWKLAIRHTYSVNYIGADGEPVSLGEYEVSAGKPFNDRRGLADKRDGYTAVGYYSDIACQDAWDDAFTHPGGEADYDVPVYVKYIEGEWELVTDYDSLVSAYRNGNVYLMNDIDCQGKTLKFANEFGKVFEGNNHKVTNFTVEDGGTSYNPSCAIFNTLGAKSEVRNVSFENVNFVFRYETTPPPTVVLNVAALAVNMEEGAKVDNVSVKGTVDTNYEGELTTRNQVYYYEEADSAVLAGVKDFSADITVNKNV